jgi:hypothetical protein
VASSSLAWMGGARTLRLSDIEGLEYEVLQERSAETRRYVLRVAEPLRGCQTDCRYTGVSPPDTRGGFRQGPAVYVPETTPARVIGPGSLRAIGSFCPEVDIGYQPGARPA